MDMNVALKINAGVSGQQAVDQLRTSLDRMGDNVNDLSNRFGKMKGAVLALAGSAVVGGFVAMMKSIIDTADRLNDLSQRTGIAVEDLDALGYAAEQNGTTLDSVSGALGKLSKNMAEAAGGSKSAVAVFKQFGISQKDLKSGAITTTEALAKIADKISDMPDGWQKAAAAQAVFGKSAAEIVPLLNAGGDAIRDSRAELEGMGALFNGGMAQAADEFNDRMAKLRRVTSALGLSIAQQVMPVLNGFVQGLIDAKTAEDKFAGDTTLVDWAKQGALAVAALIDVLRVAAQAIWAVIGSFQAVWADVKFLVSFVANAGPGGIGLAFQENRDAIMKALGERNATVEEANQRYVTLWNMDGGKIFNAVEGAIKREQEAIKKAKTGNGKAGTFNFTQPPTGPSPFDKLKTQLEEQLAKTGDLTRAQEVLNLLKLKEYADVTPAQRQELIRLAARIDTTRQLAEDEKELAAATAQADKERNERLTRELSSVAELRSSKEAEIEMLRLQGSQINMSTRDYDRLVAARQHELEVGQAVRDMLPETAARYREVANELFAARQAVEDYNYAQSRTFEAGAKRALRSYIDEVSDVAKATENVMTNAFKGMEDAMVEFAMTGKLSFKDLANSIIKDLIRIATQKAIAGLLGNIFGGFMGAQNAQAGVAGGSIGGIGSYDGGGYTGTGARSGGLDGKGGFMAILHPNETVVDHSKGQGMGGSNSVVVNVNVESNNEQVQTTEGAGELGRAISAAVKQELINQKRPGGLLAA